MGVGGCPPGLRNATSRPAQPWARVPLCHPCESSALLGKNCLSPGWPGRNRRLGEGKGLTGHGTAATRQSWDSPSAVTPTKVTCNDGTVPRHLSGLDSEARWVSGPHLLLYLPPPDGQHSPSLYLYIFYRLLPLKGKNCG